VDGRGVENRFDEILRAQHIGFDALKGVVFSGRHLLESGGMDDGVDAFEGAFNAVLIADIAKKIAHGGVPAGREFLGHFELFEFVPGKDHQPLNRGIPLQDGADKLLAEGAGTAGDEDGGIVEHGIYRVGNGNAEEKHLRPKPERNFALALWCVLSIGDMTTDEASSLDIEQGQNSLPLSLTTLSKQNL